jgi:hypothetical protein
MWKELRGFKASIPGSKQGDDLEKPGNLIDQISRPLTAALMGKA